MKTFLIYLLIATSAHAQELACQQDQNHINATVEISDQAIRKIIQKTGTESLNASLKQMEGTNLGDPIYINPCCAAGQACDDTQRLCDACSQDNVRNYSLELAWNKCFGMPIMGEGHGFYDDPLLRGLMPEPTRFRFRDFKLGEHVFGDINITQCETNGQKRTCTFELPIEKIEVIFSVDGDSLWRNAKLLDLEKLHFVIARQNGGAIPKLTFNVRFNLDGTLNTDSIQIDGQSFEQVFGPESLDVYSDGKPNFANVSGSREQINAEKIYSELLSAVQTFHKGEKPDGIFADVLNNLIKTAVAQIRSITQTTLLPEIAKMASEKIKDLEFLFKPGETRIERYNLQSFQDTENVKASLIKLGVVLDPANKNKGIADCAKNSSKVSGWEKETAKVIKALNYTDSSESAVLITKLFDRWQRCQQELAPTSKLISKINTILSSLNTLKTEIIARQRLNRDTLSTKVVALQGGANGALNVGLSFCMNKTISTPAHGINYFNNQSCLEQTDASTKVSYDLFNAYLALLQKRHNLELRRKLFAGHVDVEISQPPTINHDSKGLYLDVSGLKWNASFLGGLFSVGDLENNRIRFNIVAKEGDLLVTVSGLDSEKGRVAKILQAGLKTFNLSVDNKNILPFDLQFSDVITTDEYIGLCHNFVERP
jgi:hypothetical protein